MSNTIRLTKANDDGFDPQALGFDIKHMSNVRVYQVTKSSDLINEGHLHYVRLEFIKGEIADPSADPMIVGTIKKEITQDSGVSKIDHQWRVLWDNKLWRPLSENSEILEMFCGIKAEDVSKFAKKFADKTFRTAMAEDLIRKHKSENWKPLK